MSEKVKNRVVLSTVNALRRLDGNGNERFKFSGTVLYSMSKNLRRLNEAADDIQKARQALIKKLDLGKKTNDDGQVVQDDPKLLHQFQEEYDAILDVETEVVVAKFKISELKLDENNIPVSVLADLGWLILE